MIAPRSKSPVRSLVSRCKLRASLLLQRFEFGRRFVLRIKQSFVRRSIIDSPDWLHDLIDEAAIARVRERYVTGRSPSEVRTIVDVGANLGQSAERFARMFPSATVYTVEPAQEVFDQLQKRFAGDERVRPLRLAMSDHDGEVTLHHSEHSMCASLDAPWKETGTSESVEARRLASLFDDLGLTKIDILKVDTEGHDVTVLKGAAPLFAAGAVDMVIVECGFLQGDPCHSHFYEIAEFLKPYGLALSGFTETGNCAWIGDKFSLLYCNAIFARSPGDN